MTLDTLLTEISERVKSGSDIGVREWLNWASVLNVLLLDLDSELVEAEMVVNKMISLFIASGKSNADAKALAHGSESYKIYLLLKAKRERTQELIRISKKRADIARWQE